MINRLLIALFKWSCLLRLEICLQNIWLRKQAIVLGIQLKYFENVSLNKKWEKVFLDREYSGNIFSMFWCWLMSMQINPRIKLEAKTFAGKKYNLPYLFNSTRDNFSFLFHYSSVKMNFLQILHSFGSERKEKVMWSKTRLSAELKNLVEC